MPPFFSTRPKKKLSRRRQISSYGMMSFIGLILWNSFKIEMISKRIYFHSLLKLNYLIAITDVNNPIHYTVTINGYQPIQQNLTVFDTISNQSIPFKLRNPSFETITNTTNVPPSWNYSTPLYLPPGQHFIDVSQRLLTPLNRLSTIEICYLQSLEAAQPRVRAVFYGI